MFCQRSARVASKLKQSICQPVNPRVALFANIYDDFMKKKLDQSKLKVSPLKMPEGDENVFVNMLFGPNSKYRKDWFEGFRQTEFTYDGINNWFKEQKYEVEKAVQEFVSERHETLGSDLAAASLIVALGGRARFKGSDEWIKADENRKHNLPNVYDPNYILTGLDCSGIHLLYEGLENFNDLVKLSWLSFRGNKHLDDWCIDKISSQFPALEYLDISECERVTERGLESLYRIQTLKKLIVTNWYKSEAMELTCLLLEDCVPGLSCEMLPPPENWVKKTDEAKPESK